MVELTDISLQHLVMILGLIGGFIGLATFLYKVLGWVIKINLAIKSSHDCIRRLEKRLLDSDPDKYSKDAVGVK